MNSTNRLALAVDIGGTKIDIALIDEAGRQIGATGSHAVPFDEQAVASPAGMLDIIAPYVAQAREALGKLEGIGLCLPGKVDPATGEAVFVANLHWRNVPFVRMAAERFGLPVRADLDVHLAALGEAVWGAARGLDSFAWVTLGTGMGVCLWLNGRIHRGEHDFAGYVGHDTVDEINGYPCGCGRRGCLETFVAGPAIARQGQAARDAGLSPTLNRLAADGPVTAPMVFEAAATGEPAAAAIIDAVVRMLGLSLSWMVNLLDLRLIIMGGGVAKAGADFIQRVERSTQGYVMADEVRRDLRIVPESLPNAALFGAAAFVFQPEGR